MLALLDGSVVHLLLRIIISSTKHLINHLYTIINVLGYWRLFVFFWFRRFIRQISIELIVLLNFLLRLFLALHGTQTVAFSARAALILVFQGICGRIAFFEAEGVVSPIDDVLCVQIVMAMTVLCLCVTLLKVGQTAHSQFHCFKILVIWLMLSTQISLRQSTSTLWLII